jgi:hypothetical protein
VASHHVVSLFLFVPCEQVMGGVISVKTTLTTTVSQTLMMCVLRTMPLVRLTSGTSRWYPWTPRVPHRLTPTGSFVTKARSWSRQQTQTLASLLVSLESQRTPPLVSTKDVDDRVCGHGAEFMVIFLVALSFLGV